MQRARKSTPSQIQRWTMFFVVVGALLSAAGCNRGEPPRELGQPAPAFTIHDGSQTVSLDHYRGKVVLVTFWASYCVPCLEEFPSLLALHQRLPQLNILGVSIDDNAQAYRNFRARYNVDFPTVRDPSMNVMHRYGTIQIPEAYVINRSGNIVRKYVSAQDWNDPEIYHTLSATLNANH
jgi:cytochrome c biogenesis protein CcmG, thiol:disulfide interchange protein DsbE